MGPDLACPGGMAASRRERGMDVDFEPVEVPYRPFFIIETFRFLQAGHTPVLKTAEFLCVQLPDIRVRFAPVQPLAEVLKRIGLLPHQAGFEIRNRTIAIIFKSYLPNQLNFPQKLFDLNYSVASQFPLHTGWPLLTRDKYHHTSCRLFCTQTGPPESCF